MNEALAENKPTSILDALVAALVAALAPKRIVLFGSRATGLARGDSDYDVLVVADTQLEPADRMFVANRAVRDLGVPTDVLVYTPEEAARLATWRSSVVAAALSEGKVLYEAA
jgi:predicted nucleotidyltransferase